MPSLLKADGQTATEGKGIPTKIPTERAQKKGLQFPTNDSTLPPLQVPNLQYRHCEEEKTVVALPITSLA